MPSKSAGCFWTTKAEKRLLRSSQTLSEGFGRFVQMETATAQPKATHELSGALPQTPPGNSSPGPSLFQSNLGNQRGGLLPPYALNLPPFG